MSHRSPVTLAIAVLSFCAQDTPAQEPGVAAGNSRQLTHHPAEDRAPAWSPDGTRLLFASDRDGDYEIYSIQADGTELLRHTDNDVSDLSPAWAPTGDRFVFESQRQAPNGLWIQELADGRARLLLPDPSPELVPDWSPDGDSIVFTSVRHGNPDLYRISTDGGAVERLTVNEYRDAWPRYSASGDALIFFSRRATAGIFDDLFLLELGSRSVTRVTEHPTHHDFAPDFAPDGRRVVAGMSDREAGRRELAVHGLDGETLGRFAQGYHRVFQPTWSPDGRWIAFAARVGEDDRADVYVVPAPD